MKVLGAAAALVVLGSSGAHAQVVIADPAPAYVAPAPTYSPGPVVVAPPAVVVAPPAVVLPPEIGSAYAAAPIYGGATVINGRTGRSCTIKPDGYRWCWTP
jgi:hypothetical protein